MGQERQGLAIAAHRHLPEHRQVRHRSAIVGLSGSKRVLNGAHTLYVPAAHSITEIHLLMTTFNVKTEALHQGDYYNGERKKKPDRSVRRLFFLARYMRPDVQRGRFVALQHESLTEIN